MPTDPTTTAAALLQMLSGDFGPSVSFTKPWPQFVRVFNEYPLRAASIARELFRARDPKFMPFILSFPWDEEVPLLPRELHSSEFLTTMLEIVSDESWYKQMREIAGPDGSVGDSLLPHHLYWSLNCLGKLFIVDKGQVQRPQSVNLCLQCIPRFPMLWKLLWEYRDLVLVPNFAGIDGGVFVIVRYLVECHFFLVKQFQESVPHLSTHAAHIALLLWNRAREPRYNVKITASLIVGMFEEQHINRPEHISHFISTAVPVVVGHQDPLEIFFNSMMSKEKDLLEPKNLYNNVFLSTVILQGCPKKVDLKREEDRRKVLFTLARAFHRYQCGGSVIGDRRIGWRIPTVFLNSLNFIFKSDRQGVVDDILYNPVDLGFMPVLISALESVDYIYGDTLFEATVEWLTTGYKHYAEKMRFSGHEGATRNYAYLRRILQSRWLPILELMRSALRSPSFQSRDTSALQRIKQLWEDLGSAYHLSKKSKELDSVAALVGYVKSAEKLGGCAWRECACFGRRGVWHRTRRVCKGCWVAVYCCERCQKGDWKLGHRDVCVGRRILPTE